MCQTADAHPGNVTAHRRAVSNIKNFAALQTLRTDRAQEESAVPASRCLRNRMSMPAGRAPFS